jgi:hypothetical protein
MEQEKGNSVHLSLKNKNSLQYSVKTKRSLKKRHCQEMKKKRSGTTENLQIMPESGITKDKDGKEEQTHSE